MHNFVLASGSSHQNIKAYLSVHNYLRLLRFERMISEFTGSSGNSLWHKFWVVIGPSIHFVSLHSSTLTTSFSSRLPNPLVGNTRIFVPGDLLYSAIIREAIFYISQTPLIFCNFRHLHSFHACQVPQVSVSSPSLRWVVSDFDARAYRMSTLSGWEHLRREF